MLKIIWFWCVAFYYMIKSTVSGNQWNMIYVDLHLGDMPDGRPIRKQLVARRTISGFSIYWQDLSKLYEK